MKINTNKMRPKQFIQNVMYLMNEKYVHENTN